MSVASFPTMDGSAAPMFAGSATSMMGGMGGSMPMQGMPQMQAMGFNPSMMSMPLGSMYSSNGGMGMQQPMQQSQMGMGGMGMQQQPLGGMGMGGSMMQQQQMMQQQGLMPQGRGQGFGQQGVVMAPPASQSSGESGFKKFLRTWTGKTSDEDLVQGAQRSMQMQRRNSFAGMPASPGNAGMMGFSMPQQQQQPMSMTMQQPNMNMGMGGMGMMGQQQPMSTSMQIPNMNNMSMMGGGMGAGGGLYSSVGAFPTQMGMQPLSSSVQVPNMNNMNMMGGGGGLYSSMGAFPTGAMGGGMGGGLYSSYGGFPTQMPSFPQMQQQQPGQSLYASTGAMPNFNIYSSQMRFPTEEALQGGSAGAMPQPRRHSVGDFSALSGQGAFPAMYGSIGGGFGGFQPGTIQIPMGGENFAGFQDILATLPAGAQIISARPLGRSALDPQDPPPPDSDAGTPIYTDGGPTYSTAQVPNSSDQSSNDIRGVGITFGQEPDATTGMVRVFVQRIRPGSSAAQCGSVQEGDTLISVNGNNVFGQNLPSLRNLIPGPANTPVKIGFQSGDGQRHEVELLRTTPRGGAPTYEGNASGMQSDTPSIALGDEAGTYMQRTSVTASGHKVLYQGAPEQHTPEGWERKVDPKGYVFWVHHEDRKISYTPPGLKLDVPQGDGPGVPVGMQYNTYASSYNGSGIEVTDADIDGANHTLTQV